MCVQRVLVATTLLHSGAKFHSFLYTGPKTVRVSMKSCYGGMSKRLKQRTVTEFLSAENARKNSKQCRLPARFFDCFLGLTKSLHDRIFGSWEYCQFSSVH